MSLSKLNHPDHPQHTLTRMVSEEPFRCYGCKERGLFHCYTCNNYGCDFYLHEECADPDPYAFHPFMPKCNLRFYDKPPQLGERYCDACGKDIQGCVYQCTHKYPHDFHPHCLKLPRTKTDREGNVTVRLCKKLPMECFHCNSKKINHKIEGWCYVSTCGQYCYHIACVNELYIRNWKKMGHHLRRSGDIDNEDGETDIDTLALESVAPSHRAIVQRRSNGSLSCKVNKFWKMVVTVFRLVVSALFGDPITATAIVVGYFLTD